MEHDFSYNKLIRKQRTSRAVIKKHNMLKDDIKSDEKIDELSQEVKRNKKNHL